MNRGSRRCPSLTRACRGSQAGKPRWSAATRRFSLATEPAPAATAHRRRVSSLVAHWQTELYSHRHRYTGPEKHKFVSLPVILRIFRVEIDPVTRSAFEAGFRTLSVHAVKQASGNLSCDIGMPTRWAPNTYAMISRWRNEDALIAFAGPEWNTPVIPSGMEAFGKSCSVEHYWIDDMPAAEPPDAMDSR
ncbi:MAG: antibiotic biosynthesis monooxygenase family protein [Planctomycetia bacterium]